MLRALRDELVHLGLDPAAHPDEDVLQMMLDVEQNHVAAAARAIVDAQTAEQRASQDTTTSSSRAVHASPSPPIHHVGTAQPFRTLGPVNASVWDSQWLLALWRVVSFPFSVLGAVAMFVWRLIYGSRSTSERYELSRLSQDPTVCARNWVLALERDTQGSTSPEAISMGRVPLPPFMIGSYSEALLRVRDHIQILMVVLTSRAHSDYDAFRQQVLTDSALVRALQSPDFVVWGGDIQDREAYQVSNLLEASTFPFVAFIALQPCRSRSRGRVVPHPAVLSRLEGSPQSVLSASALCTHITEMILPRTNTYLHQLRREQHQREQERELRAEQDRAYEEASRRDQERVLQRREEEQMRLAQEASLAQAEAAKASMLQRAAQWRTWAHAHFVPKEPEAGVAPTIRVSVKLPDGRNLQRHFRPSDTLEHLYAYVDTIDAHVEDAPLSRPTGYEHTYPFQLVQTYPRRLLSHDILSSALQDVQGFGPSASLIVEPLHPDEPSGSSEEDDDDDDDDDDNHE